MQSVGSGFRYVLIALIGAVVLCLALPTIRGASIAEDYPLYLSGTLENVTMDLYGDVYIPANETLELRNCTLVFHCNAGVPYQIRGFEGSSLIVSDLDGDPTTREDMSTITSVGLPWGLYFNNGHRFELRCSELLSLGNTLVKCSEDYDLETSHIQLLGSSARFDAASAVEVRDCSFNASGGALALTGPSVTVRDCVFEGVPGPDLILMGVDAVDIGDCTFSGSGNDALRTEGPAVVHGCTFNGSATAVDLWSGGTVRDCTFTDFIRGVHGSSRGSIVVEDCAFRSQRSGGWGIDAGRDRLSVRECTFEDLAGGIRSSATRVEVNDSTFDGCDESINFFLYSTARVEGCVLRGFETGLSLSTNQPVEVVNCSLEGSGTAVNVTENALSLRLVDTDISNCSLGIKATIRNDYKPHVRLTLDLVRCRFDDIAGVAIVSHFITGTKKTLRLEDCVLTDVGIGINQTRSGPILFEDERDLINITVTLLRCRFERVGTVMSGEGSNMTVENCTFDGAVPGGTFGKGFDLWYVKPFDNDLSITGCTFTGCEEGVRIYGPIGSSASPASSVVLTDTVFDSCGYGLVGCLNGTAYLERVRFTGCDVAVNMSNTSYVRARNVTVEDGTDGLQIQRCIGVWLQDLSGSHMTGWLLDEANIDFTSWLVTVPTNITNVRIRLTGALDVRADLELYEVDLLMDGKLDDWTDVFVREGVHLSMVRTRLRSTPWGSYGLFVFHGSVLEVVDSDVSGMRVSANRPMLAGPRVTGGTVRYVNSTFWNCYRSLTISDGTAEIDGCKLSGQENCVFAERSTVTINGSLLSGTMLGLRLSASTLSAVGTTLEGTLGSMDANGSRLLIVDTMMRPLQGLSALPPGRTDVVALRGTSCTGTLERVRMEGWSRVMELTGSRIELWECQLGQGVGAEVIYGSLCTLYNTIWAGAWTVEGTDARVDVMFSHTVSASYRWSGARAGGVGVTITPSLDWVPPTAVVLGPDGMIGGVWLLQRSILEDLVLEHAPYNLTVELPGLRGKSSSACDAPTHVEIVIKDVSPPEVSIEGPGKGTLHATREVRFWGTVQELGSGFEAFMYCIGGGDWVPVPLAGGSWSVPVPLPDGTQVVSFRALDRDRNQGLNYTTVVVDTAAPFVEFLSPEDGSVLNATTITVRARVSAGEGTALAHVMLDGVTVDVGPGGEHSSELPLPREGMNMFTLEAVDASGNRALALLHITRDTLPPTLEVNAVVTPTRDVALTVSGRVSEGSVTVNGQDARVAFDGNFIMALTLVEGSNRLEVVATDLAGNVARHVLSVVLDTRAEGVVLSPLEGDIIRGDAVALVVRTEPFAEVQVPGRTGWTPANAAGDLTLELTDLVGGPIELRVTFRDALGNERVVRVNVTLVPTRSMPLDEGTIVPLVIALVIVVSVVAAVLWRKRVRGRAQDGL